MCDVNTHYNVGDKVTVEFEIKEIKPDRVSLCPLGQKWYNVINKTIFNDVVKSHTPKPVEPAEGQVWKYTGRFGEASYSEYKILFADDKSVYMERISDGYRCSSQLTSFKGDMIYCAG